MQCHDSCNNMDAINSCHASGRKPEQQGQKINSPLLTVIATRKKGGTYGFNTRSNYSTCLHRRNNGYRGNPLHGHSC